MTAVRPDDKEDQFWICKIEKIHKTEPKYLVAWFELTDDLYLYLFSFSFTFIIYYHFSQAQVAGSNPSVGRFFWLYIFLYFFIILISSFDLHFRDNTKKRKRKGRRYYESEGKARVTSGAIIARDKFEMVRRTTGSSLTTSFLMLSS